LQIAIAQSVQRELAATDLVEQLAIVRRERVQGSNTPAMPVSGLVKSAQQVAERGVFVDTGQGVEVAFGSFACHLGTAGQVSDAAAPGTPGQSVVDVAFFLSLHTKDIAALDRALRARDDAP